MMGFSPTVEVPIHIGGCFKGIFYEQLSKTENLKQ